MGLVVPLRPPTPKGMDLNQHQMKMSHCAAEPEEKKKTKLLPYLGRLSLDSVDERHNIRHL